MAPWEIWTYVPKTKLRERRGIVGVERRRTISQALLRFFPFAS